MARCATKVQRELFRSVFEARAVLSKWVEVDDTTYPHRCLGIKTTKRSTRALLWLSTRALSCRSALGTSLQEL